MKTYNQFFKSFADTENRCHLRLARSTPDKPLVIVCSHYTNYYSCSPTNGLELIAHKLFEDILNNKIKGVCLAKEFSNYDRAFAASHPFKFLLGIALGENYAHEFEVRESARQEIFNQVVWLERYLQGFLGEKEGHWQVILDSQGSPKWDDKVSETEIFAKTGYYFKDLFLSYRKLNLAKLDKRRTSTKRKGGQVSIPRLGAVNDVARMVSG